MKGHKLPGDTHAKIEKHIRKHRKYGGATPEYKGETKFEKGRGKESASRGMDESDEDLQDKPADRSYPGGGGRREEKVGKASEEKKVSSKAKFAAKGGFLKHVKEAEGEESHKHAGRKRRASGGSAEANPFTTANHAELPRGRKDIQKITKGLDKE